MYRVMRKITLPLPGARIAGCVLGILKMRKYLVSAGVLPTAFCGEGVSLRPGAVQVYADGEACAVVRYAA